MRLRDLNVEESSVSGTDFFLECAKKERDIKERYYLSIPGQAVGDTRFVRGT